MTARGSVFLIGEKWNDSAFPATHGRFLTVLAFFYLSADAAGRPVEETPGWKRRR